MHIKRTTHDLLLPSSPSCLTQIRNYTTTTRKDFVSNAIQFLLVYEFRDVSISSLKPRKVLKRGRMVKTALSVEGVRYGSEPLHTPNNIPAFAPSAGRIIMGRHSGHNKIGPSFIFRTYNFLSCSNTKEELSLHTETKAANKANEGLAKSCNSTCFLLAQILAAANKSQWSSNQSK